MAKFNYNTITNNFHNYLFHYYSSAKAKNKGFAIFKDNMQALVDYN